MGLVLKYIKPTKTGSYHYRRRVPDRLRQIIGKREIKRFLGNSEREALAEYPIVHRQTEKLFAQAEKQAAASKAPLSDLEAHEQLERRLRKLGVDLYNTAYDEDGLPVDEPVRDQLAESIIDSYPRDPETGDAVGMTKDDFALVRALYGGLPSRPAPTLSDARKLYIKEKIGEGEDADIKKVQRVEHVMKHVIKALGEDRKITAIRRTDAKKIVEHFKNEMNVKPATGRRYLNDLKAIINHAIKEYELGISSPFQGLAIKVEGNPAETRRSFTDEELRLVRKRIKHHAESELQWIWQLLEYSGCRVSEIAAIQKRDIHIDGEEIPYLRIEPNQRRGVKTAYSIKDIPLTEEALKVVKSALKASPEDHPYLFPRYGYEVSKDSTSAALMKHVRKIVSDHNVCNHSLRHTLTDKLRLAGYSEDTIKLVLGHAGSGITGQYGSREARRRIVLEALSKTNWVSF
ncbi:tyrosine-type recombinase/integrase [Roseibium aggregatum]|uniref:tyrosine-type recombinase/integrase n=1 Tax=Roseibium aggregatum TaxID=187304 RepID=UPI0025AD04B0|nr:tyrosine-type recombinase/integrase [Roseibium aggregatum]WJS03244.1 tyrosine-type recombinase/integrase [Roseibium aggregatum]